MPTKEELLGLMTDMESDRVERTVSVNNTDKFSEAICAFSNDFPNHNRPGYLFIGVDDNGRATGLPITDELLRNVAAIRNNGQILPQPAMTVQKYSLDGGDVAVVEVFPSLFPPIRYKGRVWIRTGPSKAIANETEERRLTEKRTSTAKTFDMRPVVGSQIREMSRALFEFAYLPEAIDSETLEKNHRDIKEQLASLRLYDLVYDCPTNAGILLIGTRPSYYLPGAYIQYVKFNGVKMTPEPKEKKFEGPLLTTLKSIDDFIRYNIIESKPVQGETMQEEQKSNYPLWAVRELVMNAIMHRDYESNAPIYIYEFDDRLEIINPGGLYGEVRPDNFPNVNDYRNPVLAEAMKILGYVNRFNFGVRRAEELLEENGNPPPVFELGLVTKFLVKVFQSSAWR